MFSEPFKKTEVKSMTTLDRIAKDASTEDKGGMGDAVARTENIRNWVSTHFEPGGVDGDTPKYINND